MTLSGKWFCERFNSYLMNWERTNIYPVGDSVCIWSISVAVVRPGHRLAVNSWCWYYGHVLLFLSRWECWLAWREEKVHLSLHMGAASSTESLNYSNISCLEKTLFIFEGTLVTIQVCLLTSVSDRIAWLQTTDGSKGKAILENFLKLIDNIDPHIEDKYHF